MTAALPVETVQEACDYGLDPFRRGGAVRGMLDERRNACVEAMHGLLQNARHAARGFRTADNSIGTACLRMSGGLVSKEKEVFIDRLRG